MIERLIGALSSSFSGGSDAVISADAVLIVDGGGRVSVAPTPVRGRAEVIDGLRDLMTEGTVPALASINGSYGITLASEGRVVAVITAEARDEMLSTVWVVCNPEKLRHWNAG